MSEYGLVCKNSNVIEAAAEEIAAEIGAQIDAEYGSGYPLWTPGTSELAYHNGNHARNVELASDQMLHALGMDNVARAIGRAAGRSHDLVQLHGRGEDEHRSAQKLVEIMDTYRCFTPAMKEIGRLSIVGTEPLFDDQFRLVGQKATELTYPSKEAELIAKSVACADLGSLYQPQGPLMSHLLYREIKGMPPTEAIDMQDMTTFQRNQIALQNNYEYPLAEANNVLATHRGPVTEYAEHVLEQLEQGDLESWNDLITQDTAFMQSLTA